MLQNVTHLFLEINATKCNIIKKKGDNKLKLGLKAWRRAKNITQESMAEHLGISVATYIAWEQNPDSIKIGIAYKIAEIFEVDINDIEFRA